MNSMLSRAAILSMLTSVVAIAGCKGKDGGAATDTTATASMSKPDTAMSSGAVTAAPAPLSDANIAGLVDEVNVADSTLAAAALPKLSNSDARGFAKMMMGEHHGLHVKGAQVEKAQNLTPQVPATDPFKAAVEAEQSALSSMAKSKAYDSTYIAHEVGIHQAVLEWAGKNTPQNPALQGYLKDSGPVIQRHLDKGLAVQTKLGGGPMS
jgi:predicted outer membrane protein